MAVCLVDAEGVVLSASRRAIARLGRPAHDVVGCNWRVWTPADDLPEAEKAAGIALDGRPFSRTCTAQRPDGRLATSQVLVVGTSLAKRRRGVLAVHSNVVISADPSQKPPPIGASEVAAYVALLSTELAVMAARSGMQTLSDALESVAGEAGAITAMLVRVSGVG